VLNKAVRASKKDAGAVLNQALTARDRGEIVAGTSRATIDALLSELLLDHEISGKDLARAQVMVKKHLMPTFGEVAESKLNSDHISC
jgi:hypothetical protein